MSHLTVERSSRLQARSAPLVILLVFTLTLVGTRQKDKREKKMNLKSFSVYFVMVFYLEINDNILTGKKKYIYITKLKSTNEAHGFSTPAMCGVLHVDFVGAWALSWPWPCYERQIVNFDPFAKKRLCYKNDWLAFRLHNWKSIIFIWNWRYPIFEVNLLRWKLEKTRT